MLSVGERFPQFEVQGCVNNEKTGFKKFINKDFAGKWVVYFLSASSFSMMVSCSARYS